MSSGHLQAIHEAAADEDLIARAIAAAAELAISNPEMFVRNNMHTIVSRPQGQGATEKLSDAYGYAITQRGKQLSVGEDPAVVTDDMLFYGVRAAKHLLDKEKDK